MKALLLNQDRDFDFGTEFPPNHEDLIQDLELTTLINAMAAGDKFLYDVSQRVLLASLDDLSAIEYRQQILTDCIVEPEVVREMYAIAVGAIEDRHGIWGFYSPSQPPSSVLAGAVERLEAAVVRLKQLRKIADEHTERFHSPGLTRLFRSLQQDLDDDYFDTVNQHLKQLRFRDGVLISAGLDRDNSGIDFVLRSSGEGKANWKERLGIGQRSSYSFTIPPRDEAGAQALADLRNRGLNLVANAAAQSADHISSYFTMLRAELGFYVSCLNLWDQLRARGAPASIPQPFLWEATKFSCDDLRDVCLVLRAKGEVIGNDVDADGRPLVIITGANSGGKSTFLRSVGQAQLMMQCGMFVAAQSFQASVSQGIFTHFIREEDRSMTSGRLDEELARMSVVAGQIHPHCFMLFNESFAGTNEREGSEIGRQVVRALLESEISVFFVTHQFDFADGFQKSRPESTLFLRAERESDGRRTYKLAIAPPLPTSYGKDLYRQLGGWLEDDSRHEQVAQLAERGQVSELTSDPRQPARAPKVR